MLHAKDNGTHPTATGGWNYYVTTFHVDGMWFVGVVNVQMTDDGPKYYDVTEIKETSQNGVTQSKKDCLAHLRDVLNARITQNEKNSNKKNTEAENKKQRQLNIILNSNPADDQNLSYHTWIRSTNDIKTFQEAIDENGKE